MKKQHRFTIRLLTAITCILILCMSGSAVYAGLGENQVEIRNVPSGYWIAFLTNDTTYRSTDKALADSYQEWLGKENSELHLDHVDQASTDEYIYGFKYDNWGYYEMRYRNADDTYDLPAAYQGWDHLRVLLISSDGTVRMSETIHRDDLDSLFGETVLIDFETGAIIKGGGISFEAVRFILICLALTLFIEFCVFGFFKFDKVKKNNRNFLWINILTAIPLYLSVAVLHNLGVSINIIYFVVGAIIIIIECAFYAHVLVDQNGQKRPKKAIAYGVIANLCSAICGEVVLTFMGWN